MFWILNPLENLVSLQIATLSYNPITSLKPLVELPNLVELVIYQDHGCEAQNIRSSRFT